MPPEPLATVAAALARHCRDHTEREGLRSLYAPDAVSVESAPGPDGTAETRGIPAILAKHDWWDGAMEVHAAAVEGPFLHGADRFALIFEVEATDRATGARMQFREVGVYHLDSAGRIAREEFFNAA